MTFGVAIAASAPSSAAETRARLQHKANSSMSNELRLYAFTDKREPIFHSPFNRIQIMRLAFIVAIAGRSCTRLRRGCFCRELLRLEGDMLEARREPTRALRIQVQHMPVERLLRGNPQGGANHCGLAKE